MANIGEWLTERMRVAGHDRASLARAVGRSYDCVIAWIDGRHLPYMTNAPRLAEALQVPEADVRRAILAAHEQRAAPCATGADAPAVRP